MKPLEIIAQVFAVNSAGYRILVQHSEQVTAKALDIARRHPEFRADEQFLTEAAMLHDIGVSQVYAPGIGCLGDAPYIVHGQLGRKILERLGYPRHARVCDSHVGMGLTRMDIESQSLPMEPRDCLPVSIEEQIICYADKFYSKGALEREDTVASVREKVNRWGARSVATFDEFEKKFR